MNEKFKKILLESRVTPDSDLSEKIWRVIEIREQKNARVKLWSLSALGVVSFILAIPAISSSLKALANSGFYEYFSIALSNTSAITEYWRELGMSLLESLPAMSITLSLSLIFVFFLSAKQAGKQIAPARLSF